MSSYFPPIIPPKITIVTWDQLILQKLRFMNIEIRSTFVHKRSDVPNKSFLFTTSTILVRSEYICSKEIWGSQQELFCALRAQFSQIGIHVPKRSEVPNQNCFVQCKHMIYPSDTPLICDSLCETQGLHKIVFPRMYLLPHREK